nr:Fe-S-cluster oxidoreductase [Neptuniibacter sp.]
MQCRSECGACCIAPSISSLNKPAGVKCQYLTEDYRCTIFDRPERPDVCAQFQPEKEFCGENRDQALQILTFLESETL